MKLNSYKISEETHVFIYKTVNKNKNEKTTCIVTAKYHTKSNKITNINTQRETTTERQRLIN